MFRPLPFFAFAALVLTGCSLQFGDSPDVEAVPDEAEMEGALEKRERTRVRVSPVERREMVRRITTAQEVESERQVVVLPRASGVVTDLFAEEGDTVIVGDLLAHLDRRDAEAAVRDAEIMLREAQDGELAARLGVREAEAALTGREISLDKAKRDFARNEKTGLISVQDLDQLRLTRDTAVSEKEQAVLALERAQLTETTSGTAVQRAEVALERAELAVSYTDVVAPIAGVVALRSIDVGDNVGPATEAFTIFDPEALRVVFTRPQRELAIFSPNVRERLARASGKDRETPLGDGSLVATSVPDEIEVRARTEALPGLEFEGHIERLSPGVDPASGSFRITARIDAVTEQGRPLLRPGMLVRLDIVVEKRPNALAVPKRALKREGELSYLYVVAHGEDGVDRARRVEVDTGLSDDDWVEVTARASSSLEPGELAVVIGNRELDDGEAVEAERMKSESTAQ